MLFTNEENGLRGGLAYLERYRHQLGNHVMMLESDSGVFRPIGFGFSGSRAGRARAQAIASLLRGIGADRIGGAGGGADIGPAVDAGPNQTLTLPASAALNGTVSDDGLPSPPGTVTTTWSMGSGPGAVTFANANAVDTEASFAVAGTYLLRLSATDGEQSATDSVQVTVLPVPNTPPVVDAGPNRTITLPAAAALDGTVSDDGLPDPPGAVTAAWSTTAPVLNVADFTCFLQRFGAGCP